MGKPRTKPRPSIEKTAAIHFYALTQNHDTTIRELLDAAGPHNVVITLAVRRARGTKKKRA